MWKYSGFTHHVHPLLMFESLSPLQALWFPPAVSFPRVIVLVRAAVNHLHTVPPFFRLASFKSQTPSRVYLEAG